MSKQFILSESAPKPNGTYSHAVRIGSIIFLAGQIPIDPITMKLIDGDIKAQISQCFHNLSAVCTTAGGDLKDIVKLNIYLTAIEYSHYIDEVMKDFFTSPYPARIRLVVAKLSKDALVEIDGVMVLDESI